MTQIKNKDDSESNFCESPSNITKRKHNFHLLNFIQ